MRVWQVNEAERGSGRGVVGGKRRDEGRDERFDRTAAEQQSSSSSRAQQQTELPDKQDQQAVSQRYRYFRQSVLQPPLSVRLAPCGRAKTPPLRESRVRASWK